MAEHAVGGILAFVRDFARARAQQDRRQWRRFQADELKDSTVIVAGLGPIGQAIAERIAAFEVETIGARYSPEKGGPPTR